MSSLFNDINKVLSGATDTSDKESSYIIEAWENRAQLERVHLFEAKRITDHPHPSLTSVAKAMVELAGTQNMTNIERDPFEAIKASARLFRTNDHLKESWQAMGKLVEAAHKHYEIDLKEMLGRYNDAQVSLLEVSLELPWRLTYSEPVPVEVHDYAVPGQDHVFKGTDPEDVTDDEAAMAVETEESYSPKKSSKLKKLKESLKKDKPMNSMQEALNEVRKNELTEATSVEDVYKTIYNMFVGGTFEIVDQQSNRSQGVLKVRKYSAGREYDEFLIQIKKAR